MGLLRESDVAEIRFSRIRMQSRQKVGDAEGYKYHDPEPENDEIGGAASAPAAREAHVEVSGIGQPYDERPILFRLPAPIRSPGAIGPVNAGDNHESEQREGNRHCFVDQAIQRIELATWVE